MDSRDFLEFETPVRYPDVDPHGVEAGHLRLSGVCPECGHEV